MKEVCTCFSEMELIQNWWMSHEDRQVLESKGVSKDPPKQVLLGTQWGGEENFAVQGDKSCCSY